MAIYFHAYYGLMIVFLACTGKGNVESQTTLSQNIRTFKGNPCEDCELMFIGMPASPAQVDTTEGWFDPGQKLIIKGHVYQRDKVTPATDVILYYYHTDPDGYYSPGNLDDAGSKRHGALRGWIRTGKDGSYAIYTGRPAQYPGNKTETHIHVIIKEPDLDTPYWIDAWLFDDDPLLTQDLRRRLQNRGGNGIMKIETVGNIQHAKQDVVLGLNIPGYPIKNE